MIGMELSMMRQTLGSSPKVFYSFRLKGLILLSLFTEDVLNCIFFRTEGLFVVFLAGITEDAVVTFCVFWRRLLTIS